jgi:hypothetical protein
MKLNEIKNYSQMRIQVSVKVYKELKSLLNLVPYIPQIDTCIRQNIPYVWRLVYYRIKDEINETFKYTLIDNGS